MATTQQAADNKNRTIGHYVVGKLQRLLLNFNPGKSLGQGTFGKVRIGTHTITNEQVAIKILEKDKIKDKADVERVTREINILKKVRHPNVIQLYEVSPPPNTNGFR
jgi:serine/threonine protein kinase